MTKSLAQYYSSLLNEERTNVLSSSQLVELKDIGKKSSLCSTFYVRSP